MKVITGFITNSSSSVFLVAFPERIKTLQYVKEFISNDAHAKIIFRDAKEQNRKVKKISLDNRYIIGKLTDELASGYADGVYKDFNISQKQYAKEKGITLEELDKNRRWFSSFMDQELLQRRARALEVAKRFVLETKGKYLYVFSYSDNDAPVYAELEHNRVFHKLKHIRVSHH